MATRFYRPAEPEKQFAYVLSPAAIRGGRKREGEARHVRNVLANAGGV